MAEQFCYSKFLFDVKPINIKDSFVMKSAQVKVKLLI